MRATGELLERAMLENDLRARSQVARGFILQPDAPVYVQTGLPIAWDAPESTNERPAECDHAGTGREPQRRLFKPGFDQVCSRCGTVVA